MVLTPFTDEQARTLINLEQRYQVCMEAGRTLEAMPQFAMDAAFEESLPDEPDAICRDWKNAPTGRDA